MARSIDGQLSRPDLIPLPSVQREILIKDEQVPGLYLRVSKGGARTWTLQKRFGERVTKMKIGDAERMSLMEARLRAIDLMRSIDAGDNPHTKLRAAKAWEMTVADLFERYYKGHVLPQAVSRPEHIYSMYQKHWTPLHNIIMGRLSTHDIQKWVNNLGASSGKATANRQLTNLRACIRWSLKMQIVALDGDPSAAVTRFEEIPREEYVKPGEEFGRLEAALDKRPGDATDAIRLLLFTGQRKSNVYAMKWSEIDWTSECWTVPAKKAKAHKSIRVALTARAIEVLKRREHLAATTDWVFPNEDTACGHVIDVTPIWNEIREEAKMEHITLHTLRHTFGSWLGMVNTNAFIMQRALGHNSSRTTERYTHFGVDRMRASVEEAQKMGTA